MSPESPELHKYCDILLSQVGWLFFPLLPQKPSILRILESVSSLESLKEFKGSRFMLQSAEDAQEFLGGMGRITKEGHREYRGFCAEMLVGGRHATGKLEGESV